MYEDIKDGVARAKCNQREIRKKLIASMDTKKKKPTKSYKPSVACTYSDSDSWAEVHSGKCCHPFPSVSCSSRT